MRLALAGGCMFPPQALPAFLGQHITPLLPTHWFVDTARNLQYIGLGSTSASGGVGHGGNLWTRRLVFR